MTNRDQKGRKVFFFKRGYVYVLLFCGLSLLLTVGITFAHFNEGSDDLIDRQPIVFPMEDLPTKEEFDSHLEDLKGMRKILEDALREVPKIEFKETPKSEISPELKEAPRLRIEIREIPRPRQIVPPEGSVTFARLSDPFFI